MRRLLALAFILALSGAAHAANCWPDVTKPQITNCGSVDMYLDVSGNSVPVAVATPLPVTGTVTVSAGGGVGITPTDRTITSASGVSQTLMAANASRHTLLVENTGNANCGVNPTGGTAAIGGAGTLTLAPLGSYSPSVPTLSAVTVICTAGQPIYANEN